MKMSFTHLKLVLGSFSVLLAQVLWAQDYRSAQSGPWNQASSWQIFDGATWVAAVAAPSSASGVITILNGHNITATTAITADQIVVATGGTLTLVSGVNAFTLDDGAGTDLVVDGTLSLNMALHAGTGAPSIQINGTMNWLGGTLGVGTTVAATGTLNVTTNPHALATTLTNNGTVHWLTGAINFNDGVIDNNSTFNITGNDFFGVTGGTNAFNNNSGAIFSKSGGGGSTTSNIPFINAGTVDIASGAVTISSSFASFTNTGNINLSNGSTFTINGSLTGGNFLNAGTTITGTGLIRIIQNTAINLPLNIPSTVTSEIGVTALNVTGTGSLTINGTLNWGSGTVSLPLTIASGGILNSNAGKNLNSSLTNNGTINLTDPSTGSINFTNATLTNNGTINDNYAGGRFFSSGGGTNLFVNTGLYNKTSPANAQIQFNIPVSNSGVMQGSGIFLFSGGLTNSGTISPGTASAPAVLRTNNVIFTSTSNTEVHLFDGSGPGTGHDLLEISTGGTTTLNGTLTILDNPNVPVGIYTIITNVGGGAFAATNFPTINKPTNYNAPVIAGNTVTIQKFAMFPLPLVWGNFSVEAKSGQAVLKWSTLQEENTSHFVVEHSLNGISFNAIGTVSARGNSTYTSAYSFVDAKPDLSKDNIYRIKQVDIDGRSTYSAIRSVRVYGKASAIVAAPNPVRNGLQLTVRLENIQVVLSDMNGNAIRTLKLQPGLHRVDMESLPKGVYHLAVYQDGIRLETQQILKQ